MAGARRIKSVLIALVIVACRAAVSLRAANPGDEVVIVYNTSVPESKGVAEYYAQRRQVPANQVLGFSLATNEDMSRKEFSDSLEKPLAKALEAGKLWRIASCSVPATTNHPARKEKRVVQSSIRYALAYRCASRRSPGLKRKG